MKRPSLVNPSKPTWSWWKKNIKNQLRCFAIFANRWTTHLSRSPVFASLWTKPFSMSRTVHPLKWPSWASLIRVSSWSLKNLQRYYLSCHRVRKTQRKNASFPKLLFAQLLSQSVSSTLPKKWEIRLFCSPLRSRSTEITLKPLIPNDVCQRQTGPALERPNDPSLFKPSLPKPLPLRRR